jgi:NAD(P)-dependent dehydrogenase (short-subunit alcohol dehydrogenase family)
MRRLEGKVALITGGAGGIGRAAAALFVREGASVLLVDQAGSGVEEAAAHLGDAAGGVIADVTQAEQVERCFAAAQSRFGGLDAVLLNAGITGAHSPLEDYPPDIFDTVLAVNVRAVWLGLRAAIRPLRRRGGGSIIITSSIQGLAAIPYTSAYTTAKHAVVGMMKGAALELARDRIRVNCVHPGMTDTPMMDRIHQGSGAPEQMAAAISATIPMRRYARADEVAALMLFLASDDSSYCTGASYAVDGGTLASWQSTPD